MKVSSTIASYLLDSEPGVVAWIVNIDTWPISLLIKQDCCCIFFLPPSLSLALSLCLRVCLSLALFFLSLCLDCISISVCLSFSLSLDCSFAHSLSHPLSCSLALFLSFSFFSATDIKSCYVQEHVRSPPQRQRESHLYSFPF